MDPKPQSTNPEKDKLNSQRRLFVHEYMRDRNGAQAAIRAGYSEAAARQAASTLLSNADVAAEVKRLEAEQLARIRAEHGIELTRVLKQAAMGAHFDVRGLFNPDGSPKPIDELDDTTAAAIEGIDVMEKWEGTGKDRVFVGNLVRYKLAKRHGYVDMLMKHLGGYERDNAQVGEAAGASLAALLTQMRGSSIGVVASPPPDAE